MKATFRLSVEEVAVALSLIGKPGLGHDLLAAQLGTTLSQDEIRARLLAAGHSLISRGYMAVTQEGAVGLADDLARVTRVLAQADFSIRYSRSDPAAEMLLTYHAGEGGFFEHRLEQGVVHNITEVENADAIIGGGLDFFEAAQASDFSFSPVDVPGSLLDEVKDTKEWLMVSRRLTDCGIADDAAELLAEDLVDATYRGSALRVDYDAHGVTTSNRGFLLLQGHERLWILRPFEQQGKPFVMVMPGTAEAFSQQMAALL